MGGQAGIDSYQDTWDAEAPHTRPRRLAEVVPIDAQRKWPAAPSPVRPRRGGRDDEADDIPTTGHIVLPNRRFAVVRVRTFSDARALAEHLGQQTPVLLDLSGVDADMARRIIDFSSGIVFGIYGDMKRVDAGVFLLVPAGVDVD